MKYETVTYELVRNEINKLVQAGENITIANLLKKSGGSAGKIAGFIKQWRLEQRQMNAYSISDQMLVALMKECGRAVEKAVETRDKEIKSQQELLAELSELNARQEEELQLMTELKQQLITSKEQAALFEQQLKESRESENTLISELATTKQNHFNTDIRLNQCEKELSVAINKENQAREELIAKTAKIEQLEKHISDMYAHLKK